MNEALYRKMIEKLTDIHHFLKQGGAIHPHALIFAEDEPAVDVIGKLLTEAGVKI
jgi:hypothetical protein